MKVLHVILFLGAAIGVANAYWSNEYREHGQCLAHCLPDNYHSRCKGGCLCYRRFDFPKYGYCLDPNRPIPDHFRNLGARYRGSA
uniref:Putative secreted peptide n=1 Tax=Rhipicephalus pulchellus TaxID=72859 RepID=L7MAJ8_RHIPC